MKCNSKLCDLAWGHAGKCRRVVVTTVTPVANTPEPTVANAESVANKSAKVQKWRDSNRDRYNKRMREYMRKRRAGLGIAYG